METFSKIIDFLNDRFSLPVAVLCVFFLFAPDWMLKRLELWDYVDSARALISFFFLFATALYLYGRGKKLTQYFKAKLEARTKRIIRKRVIAGQVKGLTQEENAWIYYCLRENIRTLYTTETNTTAVALEGKVLIYRPKSVYDRLSTPFTFYPEVWKYLTRKKENFCPPENIRDRQYNQRIDQFIKNLRNTG
jgi:hypothetical protein